MNAEAGQAGRVETSSFDDPSPKVSEIYALRAGNILSYLLLDALSGAVLSLVCIRCVRMYGYEAPQA
jgi:hypothetical protein